MRTLGFDLWIPPNRGIPFFSDIESLSSHSRKLSVEGLALRREPAETRCNASNDARPQSFQLFPDKTMMVAVFLRTGRLQSGHQVPLPL